MNPIKINENWSITKDAHQWILTYEAEGELNDKTGKLSKTTRTSYHSTLEQVLRHFMEGELVGNSIQELQQALTQARKEIKDFCAKL